MSDSPNGASHKRVIRFPCPHCGTTLQVPLHRAGQHTTCPTCRRRAPAPAQPKTSDPGLPPAHCCPGARAFFGSMSLAEGLLLLAVVGGGLACLLLAAAGVGRQGESATPLQHALVITACAALFAGLAILYGHGTRCPLCRRWYARKDGGNELINSAIYDRSDAAEEPDRLAAGGERRLVVKVLTYHHKHCCTHCGHQWVTTSVDRFESTVRRRTSLDADERPKRPRHRID